MHGLAKSLHTIFTFPGPYFSLLPKTGHHENKLLSFANQRYIGELADREFRQTGLHDGKVVSAQTGDLKRENVYNGDVLNTTSRIQNECNKYQRNCLVAGTLKERLKDTKGFCWESLDTVTLRGKETEVELFSLERS